MARNIDSDSLEKKIRELKAVIRSLQKRLKKVSRGYNKYIADEYKEEEEEVIPTCPSCGKGTVKETIILGRSFLACSLCDYRARG